MTLCPPRFRSVSLIGIALLWTTLTFGAVLSPSSAEAASKGPYYSVELATPTAEDRAVVGNMIWQCNGTKCLAAKASSRPMMVCQRLVRELGAVTSFSAGGKALKADDLSRCNGK